MRWSAGAGKWIIVAGERRWRATERAGFSTIDCYFHEQALSESQILEEQLIENCLREDLQPLEEPKAFEKLMELNGWNAKQLAEAIRVHPSKVTIAGFFGFALRYLIGPFMTSWISLGLAVGIGTVLALADLWAGSQLWPNPFAQLPRRCRRILRFVSQLGRILPIPLRSVAVIRRRWELRPFDSDAAVAFCCHSRVGGLLAGRRLHHRGVKHRAGFSSKSTVSAAAS